MTEAGRFTVPAEHPALAGHFPGDPVVPGVVLLDLVVEALQESAPGLRACGLPLVKFLRPVRPGEAVEISCARPEAGRVAFACQVAGIVVLRGTAAFEPA